MLARSPPVWGTFVGIKRGNPTMITTSPRKHHEKMIFALKNITPSLVKRSAAAYAEGVDRRGRQAKRAWGCPCIPGSCKGQAKRGSQGKRSAAASKGKWKLAPKVRASSNLPDKERQQVATCPKSKGKWKLARQRAPTSGNLPRRCVQKKESQEEALRIR